MLLVCVCARAQSCHFFADISLSAFHIQMRARAEHVAGRHQCTL